MKISDKFNHEIFIRTFLEVKVEEKCIFFIHGIAVQSE